MITELLGTGTLPGNQSHNGQNIISCSDGSLAHDVV